MKKAYIKNVSIWSTTISARASNFKLDLSLDLSDGRTIVVPISWYPKLEKATPNQQNNWRLIGNGEGIHWSDIDEDISLQNILDGKPSAEYKGKM